MPAQRTRTLCPYCGVGCGLIAETEGERLTLVKGDPIYPVNHGRTCRKPLELPSAVHARDRATHPLLRGSQDVRFDRASWGEALGHVAARFRAIRAEHGPDAIAFYISGQLLTEDYYVVNKLAKGFLGTNNVDSNSRLCMSSAVAGYKGAFGADGPPPAYVDLDQADCLFLLGSNAAACHPIVWSRIRDRRREGAFVICADPRPTQTAQQSDLHLAVRPGTDLPLLSAMLGVIVREGLVDEPFVKSRTSGFDEAVSVAMQWSPERAAEVCGVEADDIVTAARRFGRSPRSMALWSMGANQSTVGTLKNRALINLCLATGQIGRPGTGPLSLTGQPNAMGGRETGGLAHLLPGYRSVESAADREFMASYWGSPPISPTPGLPATDLFDALRAGRVKAVWIVATNPLVSLGNATKAREALERAELVVTQDTYHPTETSALAHVLLPAASWPEKTGTMTNSERRVGLVRKALEPPGEALADWRIFARFAQALGFGEAFAWRDEAEVFDEFAACTAGRPCDMTGISHERLRRDGGVQWPCPASVLGPSDPHPGTERLFARHRFGTADGRARFAPTPHSDPSERPCEEFPLVLTTGRVADHWHTMSRTGKSAKLKAAAGEPVLEISPYDALRCGVVDGDTASVESARGEGLFRVAVRERMQEGLVFAPMHWGALNAPAGAGALNLVTHDATDPVSRQPELKASAVRVRKATGPVARGRRRRLVVVGRGMAGLAVVEEALRRRPAQEWGITMLGEEPGPAYNRILLSKLLARTCGAAELELRPASWYEAHGVALGGAAAAIDPVARIVTGADGVVHEYDALVLATGSRPFVPPIEGAGLPHVFGFRTRADVDFLSARARAGVGAVVVGGGLLGLEAAAGLRARGAHVTVVEFAPLLMPQQLDPGSSELLARSLRAQGIEIRVGRSAASIDESSVTLDDGERLDASVVVIAAGVRAETSLAREAGLAAARGILVDDEMRTSAPSVWAVGECAEHRGVVQGLWAPVAEQARVAGASVAGDPAAFHGATPATTLKVAGIELFAGGSAKAADGHDEVVHLNTRRKTYCKLVLDGERLTGAVLVGDASQARALSELLRTGAAVPEELLESGSASAVVAAPADDGDVICSCNSVTRGEIVRAIRARALTTVIEVGNATRASTGCGSCARDVQAILDERSRSSDGNTDGTAAKPAPATIAA